MDAREIVKSILHKYSCSNYTETHCSTQDLERDLVCVMESILRQERQTREMHEAWLSLQQKYGQEKTLFQRLFA